jgi:hypothetical protein
MKTKLFGIAVVGAAAASMAAAQESKQTPPAIASVVNCRTVQDEAARLRCFDAAAAALAQAMEGGNLVAMDRESVRKTRRTLFGFDVDLPFFGGGKKHDEQPEEKEIEAAVTSAQSAGHGKWLLKLDTGAMWQTIEAAPILMPKAGDKVTIRKGVAGGYMLQYRKRTVRAKRVG